MWYQCGILTTLGSSSHLVPSWMIAQCVSMRIDGYFAWRTKVHFYTVCRETQLAQLTIDPYKLKTTEPKPTEVGFMRLSSNICNRIINALVPVMVCLAHIFSILHQNQPQVISDHFNHFDETWSICFFVKTSRVKL